MNKTIGIYAINIRGGGGITHIRELIEHFPENNNLGIGKIIIWATKNTLNQIPDKPIVVKLHKSVFEKSLIHRIYFQIFKLSNNAKLHNCDLLFIPGGSFFGSFKPIVSMSQNLLPFEFKELKRYNLLQASKLLLLRFTQTVTFRNSQGIIFLTSYAKKTVLEVIGPVQISSTIIPHGISERFNFEPRPQRRLDEITKGKPFRVLYVSIIDMYKHQSNVIEAISILRNKGFHIVLDLIGPSYPPALTYLKKKIKTFDSNNEFINYLGLVDYESINKYLLNADVGVFASSCENMPIILMEKMASGLPIACSNRGPMPEVLTDAGLYFDPENPIDIASSLEKLYLSNELRKVLAEKSYAISKNFSWMSTTYKTFKFFSELILLK